jgi:hypothetical protein
MVAEIPHIPLMVEEVVVLVPLELILFLEAGGMVVMAEQDFARLLQGNVYFMLVGAEVVHLPLAVWAVCQVLELLVAVMAGLFNQLP